MEIYFKSLKTKQIGKSLILQICHLKNLHWKFGINQQFKWFKKNIKPEDIHNICFYNQKLIGYTALRKGYYFFHNDKRKKNYLLFETLILKKNVRKLKIGKLMMNFNNFIIEKKKKPAFLICKKKLIKFYVKYGWKKINNQNYKTLYKSFNCSAMTYKLNSNTQKIYFNL